MAIEEVDTEENAAFFPADLIGKTLEEASVYVAPYGYYVRAKYVNGHPSIVTRDLKPNRINVGLTYGKITDVFEIG